MAIQIFFQTFPVIFLITIFILGLAVGSFLNVLVYRLPVMIEHDWRMQCRELLDLSNSDGIKSNEPFNLFYPRSRCRECNHTIRAWENIPIISFLLLKGRCSECNSRISIQYPLIELASGVLITIVAWQFGFSLQTLFAILLTWALICLTMIDIDHQLLPDDITIPFLWLGLTCNLYGNGLFTDIKSSLLGAILGYGVLWLVFKLFKFFTGKEGMGYGDFKLLAMLGAWVGWQLLPLIILASSLTGALVGTCLILFHSHDRHKPIPFGPYLAIAGWAALVWGNEILLTYLQWQT